MRHEYRELHEEPKRDTFGVLLPPEVGCESGVSKLGTLQIFLGVCDLSCSRVQFKKESPLESSGWKGFHRGFWHGGHPGPESLDRT